MRRSEIWCLTLLITLLPAGTAVADWNLEVVENEGRAEIHVLASTDQGAPYVGWVVTRSIRGVCDPAEPVTAVLPFPRVMDEENYRGLADTTLTVDLPYDNLLYRFEAQLVDDQGAWSPPSNPFQWPPLEAGDYLGYGDCVLLRGTLLLLGGSGTFVPIYIAPCSEGCWGAGPQMLGEFEWSDPILQYLWQGVVDVYGVPVEQDGMLHPEAYVLDRVEPAPESTCAPVATAAPTLDSFKAMFR